MAGCGMRSIRRNCQERRSINMQANAPTEAGRPEGLAKRGLP